MCFLWFFFWEQLHANICPEMNFWNVASIERELFTFEFGRNCFFDFSWSHCCSLCLWVKDIIVQVYTFKQFLMLTLHGRIRYEGVEGNTFALHIQHSLVCCQFIQLLQNKTTSSYTYYLCQNEEKICKIENIIDQLFWFFSIKMTCKIHKQ